MIGFLCLFVMCTRKIYDFFLLLCYLLLENIFFLIFSIIFLSFFIFYFLYFMFFFYFFINIFMIFFSPCTAARLAQQQEDLTREMANLAAAVGTLVQNMASPAPPASSASPAAGSAAAAASVQPPQLLDEERRRQREIFMDGVFFTLSALGAVGSCNNLPASAPWAQHGAAAAAGPVLPPPHPPALPAVAAGAVTPVRVFPPQFSAAPAGYAAGAAPPLLSAAAAALAAAPMEAPHAAAAVAPSSGVVCWSHGLPHCTACYRH